MKDMINLEMWNKLETVLTKLNVGYKVDFDNHNGFNEMIINIDTFGIMRDDVDNED